MLDSLLSRIPLWVPWLCIGFGMLAVIGIVVWFRWQMTLHPATASAAPAPTGAGAGGGTGGAQPPPTTTATAPSAEKGWKIPTAGRVNSGLIINIFIIAYILGWGISEWWNIKRWVLFSLVFAGTATAALVTVFLTAFYITTDQFRRRGLFNLFGGQLKVTEPGTRLKMPWQIPQFEADTELVTERFEETYLTGDGAPVIATVIFSYRPSEDEERTKVYFAQDPSRVKLSFKGVVSNAVKREINKRKLDTLLQEQTDVDKELAKIEKGHEDVTGYEREFGVDFSTIKVENLKVSEVAQQVLTHRFQAGNLATAMREILNVEKFPQLDKVTSEELLAFLEQVQINAGNIKKTVETKELRFPPELVAIGAALLEKFGHDLGPAVTTYLAARKKGGGKHS